MFRERMCKEPLKKLVEQEAKIESGRSRDRSRADRPSQSKFIHYTPLMKSRGRALKEACSV